MVTTVVSCALLWKMKQPLSAKWPSNLLNREGQEYVIDNFIALEQKQARDKAEVTQAAGNGFFKQAFALKHDGVDWQLDIRLYPVSLRCA